MEAVVTDKSLLVGRTPSQVRLDERYGVHLLAVSRSGKRITQRMRCSQHPGGRCSGAARQSHDYAGIARRIAVPAARRTRFATRTSWPQRVAAVGAR